MLMIVPMFITVPMFLTVPMLIIVSMFITVPMLKIVPMFITVPMSIIVPMFITVPMLIIVATFITFPTFITLPCILDAPPYGRPQNGRLCTKSVKERRRSGMGVGQPREAQGGPGNPGRRPGRRLEATVVRGKPTQGGAQGGAWMPPL